MSINLIKEELCTTRGVILRTYELDGDDTAWKYSVGSLINDELVEAVHYRDEWIRTRKDAK